MLLNLSPVEWLLLGLTAALTVALATSRRLPPGAAA